MRKLRIGMAQINTTVGDFSGNTDKILEVTDKARSYGVDLIVFPELAITGYPPEDLLLKPQFIDKNRECLNRIVGASTGLTSIVGFVDARNDLFNAAAIIHDGRLIDIYHKMYLPNYGVFDENRYFQAGTACSVYTIAGVGIGVNICEDIWYEAGPATTQALSGAEVIVNISSSPYQCSRWKFRERMLSTRASHNVSIVAYTNLVGGQDELLFDGNSMVLDEKGELIAEGAQFAEDLVIVDLDVAGVFRRRLHDPKWRKEALKLEQERRRAPMQVISEEPFTSVKPPLPRRQAQVRHFPGEVYDGLVLGTRDYVRKNGFEKVVIGLSGGIDSSLTVTIAVDALGASNVTGVSMPSRYSSPGSKSDAALLAQNLGIKLLTIPIEKVFPAYLDTLSEVFARRRTDATEENIQARIRGNILMALSNKFGWLVLSTSNKSESATGYTTLYGDMAGGFDVIKDVYKTMVYELARYRNALADKKEVIPGSILEKAPSAELRPGQKTADALPPFHLLDPVLTLYVEEDESIEQIVARGFDREMVRKVAEMVDKSEYKRRQAPPGIKITSRAFGRDRRLPITNRFKEW